jgi:hypothetical protein
MGVRRKLLSAFILLMAFSAITGCKPGSRRFSSSNGAGQGSNDSTAYAALTGRELEYLTPVLNKNPVVKFTMNDTVTSLILTTAHAQRVYSKGQRRPYTNSVQIIDVDQPWPPRWYSSAPVYTDAMYSRDTAEGYSRFDLIEDASVVNGYFSFHKMLSRQTVKKGPEMDHPELSAYLLLNDKMECIDSVGNNRSARTISYHGISVNARGERLVTAKKDTYLDLRDYSGKQSDCCVHCIVDIIEILNSEDSVIFSWNPLYHIDPRLFSYKETLAHPSFAGGDVIHWTRITTARWDYDGNILYSMKNLGIGKVSVADGHVIWQINTAQMPLISGKDTAQWYNQHDYTFISEKDNSALYSLYSNGLSSVNNDSMIIPPRGVLFEQNKKTEAVKVLRYQHPINKYITEGQGGYSYTKDGDYVLSYGYLVQPVSKTNEFTDDIEYGRNDTVYAVYQLPQQVTCYKAQKLANFKRPPRPVITQKGDELLATGEDMNDFTWYRLSGNNKTLVDKVGNGNSFKYGAGGTFCVEAKYGIGYAVSKSFTVFSNNQASVH